MKHFAFYSTRVTDLQLDWEDYTPIDTLEGPVWIRVAIIEDVNDDPLAVGWEQMRPGEHLLNTEPVG